MKLYSTNNKENIVDLKYAVLQGFPKDKGLFMPCEIPQLKDGFIANIGNLSFAEHAYEVCRTLLQGAIPEEKLQSIIHSAINFPAPVVKLNDSQSVLELFHGPSLAFKDFGARFMAQVMSYFNEGNTKELTILVATSGDTGGAVAAGFYKALGINVVILYPKGKVSLLQEKQLTTLGENITALEIDGTFDDCQAIVKRAFLDEDLIASYQLASANSINIARLIPQSFYYFEAYKQLNTSKDVSFCIPSGNFGNLTAGLLGHRMGLPVKHFIAATNANDIVPQYLESGEYNPKPSVRTLSNAMDVGAPSNFARIMDLYGFTWNIVKDKIKGYAFDDESTRRMVKSIYDKYDYIIDPHGAVGCLALDEYQKEYPDTIGVVLETAHSSKFKDDMDDILGFDIPVPDRLAALKDKEKVAVPLSKDYEDFKSWMLR